MSNSEIIWLEETLLNAQYRFAKTMKEIPHAYTLKRTWKNPEDFNKCVQLLHKHSYEGWFFKTKYNYYNIGEFKYWSMDKDLSQVILINRALI